MNCSHSSSPSLPSAASSALAVPPSSSTLLPSSAAMTFFPSTAQMGPTTADGMICFDKLTPTEKNFRRCEWLVFQSPIVRILLEILNITVYMELNNRSNLFFQLSNLIGLISLLVGTYGSYIIVPAGASLLRKYRLLLLFRLVDVSQELWSVQKLIADLLCAFKVIQPSKDLDPTPKAQFFISFLLCLEMLLASVLATFLFHPSHCALFDRLRPNQNDVGGDTKSDDISLLSDRANSERKA
ncbi:hypothetical protein GPALN_007975 [Globodera pallida]|nr:hypothetical protein GPALN_007975 [Globodera pallida]